MLGLNKLYFFPSSFTETSYNSYHRCYLYAVGQALSRPRELDEQGYILEASIEAAAKEIINLKDSLNEWDSKVGDGDCGSTVSSLTKS